MENKLTNRNTQELRLALLNYNNNGHFYWAIQAGLLTPLTFARHRLSPLADFTSGAYFLHNGDSEFVTVNLRILHCQL